MKQARIVERKPTPKGLHFWYELVDVAASRGETPLRSVSARYQRGAPSHVDPDAQRAALATLHAWAQENGWTVVEV